MTGCELCGKKLVTLSESCKQRAWDEALSKISRDHLLEGDIQVTRACLLVVTEPNTDAWAMCKPFPVTNLDFIWTLDDVQWTTIPPPGGGGSVPWCGGY